VASQSAGPTEASDQQSNKKDKSKGKGKGKDMPSTPDRSSSTTTLRSSVDGKRRPSHIRSEGRTKSLMAEVEKRTDSTKVHLNMVVIGHVDAGKSTIMGHCLFQLGHVDKKQMHKFRSESERAGKSSFVYAWVLDEHSTERDRGITMDIAMKTFETTNRHVTLLDAPGHRDFVPNMINGAAQADVAILVINSTLGEFERGFDSDGQTKEHAILAKSLGVNQLVIACNKMDTCEWSEARFKEIQEKLSPFLRQTGYRPQNLRYVPCSGFTGENLTERTVAELDWYDGPTLVEAIDTFRPPPRLFARPFRLCIADIYKELNLGATVTGKIESGMIAPKDTLLMVPGNESCTVKAVQHRHTVVKFAAAGDNVELGLVGIDFANLGVGKYLCDPAHPIPLVRTFKAQIITFRDLEMPILKGTQVVLHGQSMNEPATITRLYAILDKQTNEETKKRPRALGENVLASVRITPSRPICLELYSEFRQLGRVMLRDRGRTIAAGIVVEMTRIDQ